MTKSYCYRGFVIAVAPTPVTTTESGQEQSFESLGYVANVALSTQLATGDWAIKFEAGAPSGRLHKRASDVFFDGYQAGAKVVDDVIAVMGDALVPSQPVLN